MYAFVRFIVHLCTRDVHLCTRDVRDVHFIDLNFKES